MVHRADLETAEDKEFARDLVALIPQLRAFARTLTYNGTEADDLAQEAFLRAWKSRHQYVAGSNLRAWAFIILRNQFLTEKRRSWRSVDLDPSVAEQRLRSHDNPTATIELDDVRQALNHLPPPQREAVILVGAGGLSYEEAAEICGCAVGTVKSRVHRGRQALEALLESGNFPRDGSAPSRAAASILRGASSRRMSGEGVAAWAPD